MATGSAIIVGGRGGIGSALAAELAARGQYHDVVALSRSSSPPVDLLNESSISDAASALAKAGIAPNLIIVATGMLHKDGHEPEKSLRNLDVDWMIENYRLNAIGPALIAKYFLPLMPRTGRACLAVLSARVGSISDNRLGGWHSYRASKAALNMIVRNISIEWQRKNSDCIVVSLHPGTVETPLSAPFKGNPAHKRFTPQQAARQLLDVLETIKPGQSGQMFDYVGTVIDP